MCYFIICLWTYVRACPSLFPSCYPGLWDPWHYSGTGLLRVLDHRQVSQLVVIAPVTVLSCTVAHHRGLVQGGLQCGHCTAPAEGGSKSGRLLPSVMSGHQLPTVVCVHPKQKPVSAGIGCDMWCDRCVLSVCTTHLHLYTFMYIHTYTNTTHLYISTTPITCPQGKYVHAVLIIGSTPITPAIVFLYAYS